MKKSGEQLVKVRDSDQPENNNSSKKLLPGDMYKISLRDNDKKTMRAIEGEENKSKKIEVQNPKEFRSSLNESFHMMDAIEESEKKQNTSVSMTQRLRGKSMDHSKSYTENTRKRQISLNHKQAE
jgi:hypothetical protein